jgi:1-acyl-sn-glycerol-3-phosphate acyltransferase
VVTPVYFFLPQRACMAVVASWARRTVWLLRVVAGTKVEFRGLKNLPKDGAYILAAKHQSLFETFALLSVVPNPAYVIKRELLYLPIWGWWAWKADMIYVTRGAKSAALKEIADGGRKAIAQGRPIFIHPEGTRRPPGAPPDYKYGVVHLYNELGVPVVAAALNSGLYWPRRRFMRFSGTIVVSFLPAIEPGLPARAFLNRLVAETEGVCDRLLVEADKADPRPPFGPEAKAKLAEIEAAGGIDA